MGIDLSFLINKKKARNYYSIISNVLQEKRKENRRLRLSKRFV